MSLHCGHTLAVSGVTAFARTDIEHAKSPTAVTASACGAHRGATDTARYVGGDFRGGNAPATTRGTSAATRTGRQRRLMNRLTAAASDQHYRTSRRVARGRDNQAETAPGTQPSSKTQPPFPLGFIAWFCVFQCSKLFYPSAFPRDYLPLAILRCIHDSLTTSVVFSIRDNGLFEVRRKIHCGDAWVRFKMPSGSPVTRNDCQV